MNYRLEQKDAYALNPNPTSTCVELLDHNHENGRSKQKTDTLETLATPRAGVTTQAPTLPASVRLRQNVQFLSLSERIANQPQGQAALPNQTPAFELFRLELNFSTDTEALKTLLQNTKQAAFVILFPLFVGAVTFYLFMD